MPRQTRVQKYRKLRSEIDEMDNDSLEQIEADARNKKNEIVKNSVRHASKKEMNDVKQSTLTLSIEELLEGHSEYIGLKEKQQQEQLLKRKKLWLNFFYMGIGLIILIVIVITLFNMFSS